MTDSFRYAVVRVPGSGPPALAGAPNDFATETEAEARIVEIEREHRMAHHTYLTIVPTLVHEPMRYRRRESLFDRGRSVRISAQ